MESRWQLGFENVAKAMDDKWNKMQNIYMKDGYILNKFLGGNLGLNQKHAKPKDLSIYFHVPLCKRICPYCNFYKIPYQQNIKDPLTEALSSEISQNKQKIKNHSISSIYFGGGSPTLLSHKNISKLLSLLQNITHIKKNCEITIEANPSDISIKLLELILLLMRLCSEI